MTHDLAGVQRHPFGSAELRHEAVAIVGEAARAEERAGLVTPHGATECASTVAGRLEGSPRQYRSQHGPLHTEGDVAVSFSALR